MLTKPGVYKVIWHNTYSYMKAKTLKYRLRVLYKKDQIEEKQLREKNSMSLDELFTINELSEIEDSTYKALKSIYPGFVPIVKIQRPS
mmetsp:Transcript_12043/g.11915  ORF Transcript_12043/g.11915 Transcript_12043/m.11915 type:complete len:88 (-) Transcript_12043:918-1181(-)